MITETTMYNVKNRSSSVVIYRIPESNLRREFAPGETKKIPFGELEKLTYQQGGKEILENFLQIIDETATTELAVNREPEYDMSEADIKELLLNGSLDAFLDALDFAPIGVVDLIKTMSVQLPLTDLNKRRALRDKTGFDVDKALIHIEEEKAEEEAPKAPIAQRRVQKTAVADKPATTTARRTTTTYKKVEKKVEPVVTEE